MKYIEIQNKSRKIILLKNICTINWRILLMTKKAKLINFEFMECRCAWYNHDRDGSWNFIYLTGCPANRSSDRTLIDLGDF
jgi:hypothetical protein